jgi:3-oxoadipate enol-lactonase
VSSPSSNFGISGCLQFYRHCDFDYDEHDSTKAGPLVKKKINGIDVRYTVTGAGPWVALSHSLACRLEMWDEEVRRLSKRFTVLAYDSRGHGESGAPPGPYTLDMIADDIKGLFDALGIAHAHWIGLSMGGVFGLAAALKYPGIFDSMVLADTSSRLSDEGIAAFKERVAVVKTGTMEAMVQPTLKRWFKDSFREKNPELMARVADWIRKTPLEGYIGTSAAIPTIDVTHRLGEIDVPCLVMVGADDIAMPLPMAQTLQRHLPRPELYVVPDAGHLSNLEQPEAFNAGLDKFYARIA